MRNYKHVDKYLNELVKSVYPQPQDKGHTAWALEAVNAFNSIMKDVHSVLDLGCGEAFLQGVFESLGMEYAGICLGQDYEVAKSAGRNVYQADFTFSDWHDNAFDLLFSRHSLEHSPMPLLTLMEWRRIAKKYVAIVVPAPEHWGYGGQNHYFVLNDAQWRVLFEAAGFEVTYFNTKRQNMTTDPTKPEVEIEYWYLLEKASQE